MSSQEDQEKALAIAHEATAFAKSRFGQHYLQRLADLKQLHLEATMNIVLSDSERAHHGSLAKAKDEELDYFRAAQLVTEPNVVKRILNQIGGKWSGK